MQILLTGQSVFRLTGLLYSVFRICILHIVPATSIPRQDLSKTFMQSNSRASTRPDEHDANRLLYHIREIKMWWFSRIGGRQCGRHFQHHCCHDDLVSRPETARQSRAPRRCRRGTASQGMRRTPRGLRRPGRWPTASGSSGGQFGCNSTPHDQQVRHAHFFDRTVGGVGLAEPDEERGHVFGWGGSNCGPNEVGRQKRFGLHGPDRRFEHRCLT